MTTDLLPLDGSSPLSSSGASLADGPDGLSAEGHMEFVTAAAHGPFSGAVVSLLPAPDEADRLAVDGLEPPDSLHVTLAWLGDTDGDPAPTVGRDEVEAAVRQAVGGVADEIVADAFAVATFNPDGFDPDRDPATVLLLQSDDLATVRDAVQAVVDDLSTFPVWFPHLTLGYNVDALDDETITARVGPVRFDRVSVAYGSDDVVEIPLADPAAPEEESAMTARHRIDVPTTYRTTLQDDDEETPEVEETVRATVGWEGILMLEGVLTGDARMFERGAIRWDDPPLPLRWARTDEGEHRGAVTVGRILEVWRDGDEIHGRGDLDLRVEEARELADLLDDPDGQGPTVSGVSADLDEVDVEIRISRELMEAGIPDPDRPVVDEDGRETVVAFDSEEEVMVTTDARLRAATVVDLPAFAEARIRLAADDGTVEPPEDEPALVASAERFVPPREWFDDPALDGPTPLTVGDDGRVFGHLATWGTCHTAFAECVEPPRSSADYRYFHVGAVRTSDGSEVATGRITLDTLHAGRRLSAVDTLAHYENTGLAVADVRAGEDEHGIWIAGALRPGVDADTVGTLRASPLSGDWRRVGGTLELVAALAVNTPGFPIPRAMVASGHVTALQSTGALAPRGELDGIALDGLDRDEVDALRRVARREIAVANARAAEAASARRRVLVASAASRVRRG